MRRFQRKHGIEGDVQRAALVILSFDEDGDQKLNRMEFAITIVKYAKAVDVGVHDLVDFMCVSSVLADDDEFEKAYVKAIAPSATKAIKEIKGAMRG
jgi:hypothetical protein